MIRAGICLRVGAAAVLVLVGCASDIQLGGGPTMVAGSSNTNAAGFLDAYNKMVGAPQSGGYSYGPQQPQVMDSQMAKQKPLSLVPIDRWC